MSIEQFQDSHPNYERYEHHTLHTDSIPYGFGSAIKGLLQGYSDGNSHVLSRIVNKILTSLPEQGTTNTGLSWLIDDLDRAVDKLLKKKFVKIMNVILKVVEFEESDELIENINEVCEEYNFAYKLVEEKEVFRFVYKWVLSEELDEVDESQDDISEPESIPTVTPTATDWFLDPPTSVVSPQTEEKKHKQVTTSLGNLSPAPVTVNQSNEDNVPDRKVDGEVSSHEMVDVAIVAALEEELRPLLSIKGVKWEKTFEGIEYTTYHKAVFKDGNKEVKVVAAHCPQMGMAAATLLSMNMIFKFKPKNLIMIGIAAGVKNDNSAFGDILIAESSFDYGSGKITAVSDGTSTFVPDYRKINIDSTLLGMLNRDHKKILQEIYDDYNGPKSNIRHCPQKIFGPVASGAMVVANGEVIEEIKKHERKLIGIDMETYGVYYAAHHCPEPRPKFVSIKAICDFADEKKGDSFHSYAAYVSANFLHKFLLEEQL